jgi:hypothetical protein
MLSCKSRFAAFIPLSTRLRETFLLVAVTIPKKAKSIIVISKLNNRAFRSLEEKFTFGFEFSVVRVGEKTPLATGAADLPWSRSGSLELELEAGDYIVYVKIIQSRVLNPQKDYEDRKDTPRQYPELVNVRPSVLLV